MAGPSDLPEADAPQSAAATKPARKPAPVRASLSDVLSGGALGVFLGMVIGLSSTPVVSIVVAALVALLASVFGLTDKPFPGISKPGAARLAAFGLAASVATPLAVWTRTHDLLAPSIEERLRELSAMGITTPREQAELLRYERFGLVPTGMTAASKDDAAPKGPSGVLYTAPASFCENLKRLQGSPTADILTLLENADEPRRKLGRIIAGLPADAQQAALKAAPIYLCEGS
jgi:hypothetical protein